MKTSTIPTLLFLILFSFAALIEKEYTTIKISSSEILDKCIDHYDPKGLWDHYAGTVHLKTIFPEQNYEEKLEINITTGFYKSTQLNTKNPIVRGMKDGECIRIIGDSSALTDKQIADKGLSCDNIKVYREHHTCHFGFVMNIEKAGLKIGEEVKEEKFNGWNCYVVSFSGNKNDVVNNYYEGTGKLYIDRDNYMLRGKEVYPPNSPKRKIIYFGEINVNGILMPEVFVYYMIDNNQYALLDVFNTGEN